MAKSDRANAQLSWLVFVSREFCHSFVIRASAFVIAFTCTFAFADTNATPVVRHIQYGFTLQNSKGEVLPLAEFWTYAPVKRTSHQTCGAIKASHPYQLTEDELGNQILYFSFPGFPPYAEKIVTIEADAVLKESPAPASTADAGAWLKSEPFVEIDDPEFQRHAPSLGGTSAVSRAQAVFQWVSQNLKDDGYSARDRGALYALIHKKGDCTEFMYLFVALCRRQQIPARGLGGYVCARNTILMPADYHDWAEFYDGATWQIADPQRKVFMRDASQYVATRIIGRNGGPMENFARFRFKGDGLKVTMNQRGM